MSGFPIATTAPDTDVGVALEREAKSRWTAGPLGTTAAAASAGCGSDGAAILSIPIGSAQALGGLSNAGGTA